MAIKRRNEAKKSRHARCWKSGEARKLERQAEQKQRERRNKKLRAEGKPTPWEAAKAKRQARRGTPEAQPRTDRCNNILLPDGNVKPCCSAKSPQKCRHLEYPPEWRRWMRQLADA
jgi:hypothetical protein